MPVDASIYQNFNRPTVALLDPYEIQARKNAIRNALAQGTLQDQQIQGGQLALTQQRQAMASKQAARDYLQPPANSLAPAPAPGGPAPAGPLPFSVDGGVNPDATAGGPLPQAQTQPVAVPARPAIPTMADLIRHGVDPGDAAGLIESFQKVDKTSADIDATRATALKANNEANELITQQQSDMANKVVKSNMNPAVLAWHLQHYASLGPQQAQQAQAVGQRLTQLAPADQLALMTSLAGAPKTVEANAKIEDAATTKRLADANIPRINADAQLAQLTAAGKAPIQPAVQAQLNQQKIRDAQVKANEDARIGIERGNSQVARAAADPWGALGLNQHPMGGGAGADLHGADFLKTLPPQMAATVKAVAEGRQTNLPRGGKELDQLMGAANQYDPSYSVQRAQTRTAFQTGAQGKNIGNLNTAVVHLDQYHEVMKAQNNGTFQPGNQLYNWAAEKFGSAAVTNPDFVRQSLAGEAANALKGNATDPEIAGIMTTLGKNQSSAQQEGTALAGLHILRAKLNTYDEQYHQVSPDDPWSPVLPSAGKVFARYGMPVGNSAGVAPAAAHAVGDTVMYNGAAHKVAAIKPNGKLVLEGN